MISLKSLTPDELLRAKLIRRGFKPGSLQISGCHLSFLEAGERTKPTILFIHGIGAASVHFERVLIGMQKRGYHILAPDLPGHGFSHEHDERLTADRLFTSLLQFIDALAPERFYVVGNSLGGALALRVGLHRAERVLALAAISPAGGFETDAEWAEFKKGFDLGSREAVKKFLARIYVRKPWYLPLFYSFARKAMGRKGVQELLASTTLADYADGNRLATLKPPLLFIWGKEEKIFSATHLAWFRRMLPASAEIEEPEGVGHCPQLDSPAWLNARLARFFSQHPAAQKRA